MQRRQTSINITLKLTQIMNRNECSHGNTNNCQECSLVKMVAYLQTDDKIVWYSYFKEDKRYGRLEMISGQMGSRLQKKHGEAIKKIMFFDNKTAGKPMIGES